jgi:hypothetical protein
MLTAKVINHKQKFSKNKLRWFSLEEPTLEINPKVKNESYILSF